MKALVFDGALELKDIPDPQPEPGEALIAVRSAGICNTDIELVKGYMGFSGVPGHEFCGTVISAPDSAWVGKRVTGEINAPCGECPMCARGLGTHCPNRTVLGIQGRQGAFAEKLGLPVENLHEVPAAIDDATATFIEPVAACFEILEQADPPRAEDGEGRVLVIGDGKLGILAAQVLKSSGCDTVCAGRHRRKLAMIEKEFGIEAVEASKLEKDGAERFRFIVECSGKPGGLETATRLIEPRGTIVLKSTYAEKPCMDMAPWVINEVTVVGSRCGPFEPAIEALAKKEVNPLPLVDETYPLEKAVEAFKAAQAPGVGKILINVGV